MFFLYFIIVHINHVVLYVDLEHLSALQRKNIYTCAH